VTRVANGRHARFYFGGPDVDPLAVTYHKPIKGKLRQLTIGPKLMRKVLRVR
jgi:hypothetical protein